MEQKRIEGRWDCVYCDSKGIKARFATCPNCGKSRGVDTVFYLPDDIEAATLTKEEASKTTNEPDWLCDYCDSYNRSDACRCKKCGAPRESSVNNYATLNSYSKGEQNG
jgi:hypothetical protein